MASKRGGLGRGLSALFGNNAAGLSPKPGDIVQAIPTDKIQPNRYQPRREFNSEALQELAESIQTYGILQPVIVRKIGNERYELIAGERRLRASKIVGLVEIPAIVRDYTDAQTSEISIIENVQRQELNVIEEALAYERLVKEFGHTKEELATKIGRSRSYIANLLRLLKLAPKVKEWISIGKLTASQARPLLAVEDEELQTTAAEMIIAEDLSVKKVEAFVKEMKVSGLIPAERPKKPPEKKVIQETTNSKPSEEEKPSTTSKTIEVGHDDYVKLVENKLAEMLGTQVKIIADNSTNQIQIDFSDDSQLLRLVRNLDRTLPNMNGKQITTKEEKIAALRKFSTEGTVF